MAGASAPAITQTVGVNRINNRGGGEMVKRLLKMILWVALLLGYLIGMQKLGEYRLQRSHEMTLKREALERAGY